MGTVFRFSTNGTLTTLYSFTGDGANHDGASPYIMQLVEGDPGVFYGTTSEGGTNGLGTVFQVMTNGVLNTLCEFNGTNGSTPYAGLSLGSDGFFYGSTISGGTSNYGVVFRIGTNGNFSPIFQFQSPSFPEGGVVAGINNNLYGAIYRGGAVGYGAIFRLTTNGFLTALYSFANGADGANPFAGVTLGPGGTLYGATLTSGRGGDGTVFRLNDASRPTLTITTPTNNMFVSNGVYTVIGTAADNGGVANVFYSFNNGPWLNASTTNSYINWTAHVNPVVGTNTFSAYAMDDAGHFSTTNPVKFVYILSGVLDLAITGKGTLSPNFSNAFLQIGITYSMKATPGSGFSFVNWTDGVGNVVTNGETLRFVMASNLTFRANFLDVTRPTVSITTPTNNMLVSNAVYTIVGKATDNGTLTNVFYSLNNSPWASATMGNNWSNWTAQVNLTAGTNMISAYSADSAGNLSPTNPVKFVYIVSGILNLGTTGKGTLSPNYSNTFLQIGIPYSIKATAATGFAFVNWTDGIGNVLTNGATLKFIMASNLTFRANFADVSPPTVTIVAPTSGQHISNALATVIGTASDNSKVAGVWYQLNGGTWNQPYSGNGWTNWTAKAELTAGTNIIKAYAQDLMGNLSTTSSVSFISSNTFMLQLAFASPQPVASNGFSYALQVSLGLNGHIQVSTNLQNWTVLTNFVGTNNTLHFRDAAATNLNLRFYRAVIP